MAQEADAPRRGARALRVMASVAVAAALLFGVLPQVADLSEVWATITAMTWLEVTSLLVAAGWNIATYQFVMMAALPGLSLSRAFMAGQLSTAISNTVPAGAVVGVGITYTVLRSFGHDTTSIAIASGVTGVWNTFAKLGIPVVALAWLTIDGRASTGLVAAAVAGLGALVAAIVLGALSLSSEQLAVRIGDRLARGVSAARRLLRKGPVQGWGTALAQFQRDSIGLLRRRWVAITVATVVSHLSLYFVLLLALRHVGVGREVVSDAEVFGAFAFVRLATALPITPGGLGIVELGMTAALTLAGGPQAPVLAGVLVYRALTYVLQVPLGALSWVAWRRIDGGRAEAEAGGTGAQPREVTRSR